MAKGSRSYWVGLLKVIRLACQYINRYEGKLPANIPQAVKDAFPYIRGACAALEAYDKTNAGGS